MRILVVSKFRRVTGGVEAHIDRLKLLLEADGHEVEFVSSEDMDRSEFTAKPSSARAAGQSVMSVLWNKEAARLVRDRAARFKPDLVHFHSIYHQLSPSVLTAAAGYPRVMTLHDYKLAAPCYQLVRDGDICTLCVGRRIPTPALRYRCVKGSLVGSALCAAEQFVHHGRYNSEVSRFIVPSDYARKLLIDGGVNAAKVRTVHWSSGSRDSYSGSNVGEQERRPYILFAGRLNVVKGLDLLLGAWERSTAGSRYDLVIAGDGPLRPMVEEAAARDSRIVFSGFLPRRSVDLLVGAAAVVYVPSRMPETLGLSALEALAAGTPLVASSRGALADLVGSGVLELEDVTTDAVLASLERISTEPDLLSTMKGELASRDLSTYSDDAMLRGVLSVYEEARLA